MKKRTIVAILSLIAILLTGVVSFAAVDKVPGVPKNAMLVYSMSFNQAQKDAMGKYFDMVIKNPEFDKMAAKFAEESGTAFPKGLFEKVKNITSMTMAAVANSKDVKKEPAMILIANFDNDKAPAEVVEKLKEKLIEISKKEQKEVVFTEAAEQGLKVFKAEAKDKSKDHMKDKDAMLFINGSLLGFIIQEKSEDVLKNVAAALKDEKETIAVNPKFKSACEKVGKEASSIMFFDAEVLGKIDDPAQKKVAEVLNYVVMGGYMTDDLSKMTTNGIVSLNDPKDEEAKKVMNLVKMLIGGVKREAHSSVAMPADVIMYVDLKLNLTKDLFKTTELAPAPAILMMAGISLDEDILSWLDGEVFVAIGDIMNPKEIKEKGIIPDVYLGLKSASAEKAGKLVEKLQALAKSSPNPIELKDETIAGVKVKVAELKDIPFKNATLTLGQVDKYFIIATNKSAFEKAINASAKKETSLAANTEYKDLAIFDAGAFLTYFMNTDKFTKIASELAPMGASTKSNEFMKYLAANASIQGNDVKGSFVVKMDLSKITPELVSQVLKEIVDKSKQKTPEIAPAPAPVLVPENKEKTVEPSKDEKPAEKKDAEDDDKDE